jgi:hypothetical protein
LSTHLVHVPCPQVGQVTALVSGGGPAEWAALVDWAEQVRPSLLEKHIRTTLGGLYSLHLPVLPAPHTCEKLTQ